MGRLGKMTTARNRLTTYVLIALLALVVRLLVGVSMGGIRHPQLFEYDAIAQSMIAGRGYLFHHLDVDYYSFVTPLYPWITAASYSLGKSIVPMMLVQIVVGAMLAGFAALVGDRLYPNSVAGIAAGLLVALHPGLVIYSATKAHPLTFDAAFFALALLQAFRIVDRPTVKRFVIFGLIVGLGALSRGTVLIALPVVGIWYLAITARRLWPNAICKLFVAGVCTVAVIAPWIIRNSMLHHQFVFLLTTDAEDFWRGNNPHASGGSYVDSKKLVLDELSPDEQSALRHQPNEIAQANWFTAQSHDFIRSHGGASAQLFVKKLFYFWWFAPQTGVEYPNLWRQIYVLYYAIALLFAFIGLWRTIRAGPPAAHFSILIVVFIIALSILQSVYYVEGRHRWGIELMVLALAGAGVATLFNLARASGHERIKAK